jgi:pheromone shutdown-related protein TraB
MSDSDVVRLEAGGRDIILVGTAHISRESADLVRQVIETERPDCVCVELDRARFEQLDQRQRFELLDLKQIIRQRQLTPLLLNLVLVSYQQQLGGQLGVVPGAELLEATEVARRLEIPIELCDRDAKTTLRRAWGAISPWRRFMLFGSVLTSVFNRPQLSEEDLRRLREQDVATRLIQELGEAFPGITTALIDERDTYLAEKIRRAPGRRIVAVVGAGHVDGMRTALLAARAVDLTELETTPPTSAAWHWLAWSMPVAIFGAIGWIAWHKGAAVAGDNVLFWILVTGVPSMLGTLIAAAHPFAALSAFVAAPITTLTPVLGVGYVAAFVQAYMRPPRVYELRTVAKDAGSLTKWWSNRLLRILLVFILSSLGGSIGMFAGSAGILRSLFH